jgi:methylated-DNA-protein-cysteine methyltransferase related protein
VRQRPGARSRPAVSSYRLLYGVVRRIPSGRVATYGQVADLAGLPRQARLAGYALHALPDGTPLPWHRVVGAGGRLSLAALDPNSGLTQRIRLEKEGVRFDARGRVDLARFQWRPRRSP